VVEAIGFASAQVTAATEVPESTEKLFGSHKASHSVLPSAGIVLIGKSPKPIGAVPAARELSHGGLVSGSVSSGNLVGVGERPLAGPLSVRTRVSRIEALVVVGSAKSGGVLVLAATRPRTAALGTA
jgi:hypothetical protein